MADQFEAARAAILSAITGAGDPNAAHTAALHAHDRQAEDWHALAGDILYTAGATAGAHLTSALQQHASTADVPDYDPDDDGDDALTAFIASQQSTLATSVQDHTGDMLAAALLAAVAAASSASSTQPLHDAVNGLYDQWTGQGDTGSDYAASLAGDWTELGWNHGEYDAATQVDAYGGGGTEVQRTWTATMDARTRPEHADADGQTVGLHEPFDVGGESLMYPGDPTGSAGNTIYCRCSVSYAVVSASGAVIATGDETDMGA